MAGVTMAQILFFGISTLSRKQLRHKSAVIKLVIRECVSTPYEGLAGVKVHPQYRIEPIYSML